MTYSLRGLAAADIELRALDGPVHSGMAGGAVPDPVMALARVLSSLVDEHGDVAIDGVWDDVRPLAASEREPIAGFDDDAERVRPGHGSPPRGRAHRRSIGSPARAVVVASDADGHRNRRSPHQGVVEPDRGARSRARVSLRLAPGQDPAKVSAQLRAHVEARVPWGLELMFTALDEAAPAWETEPSGPAFDAATRALHTGFGVAPVLMGVGGSIPFVGPFASAFGGIPSLLLGPCDPGSRIHGEDESLHLDDWRKLIRSEVCLLAELA